MTNEALELLSMEFNSQHSLHGEEALENPDTSGAVQVRRAADTFPWGRPETQAGDKLIRVSHLYVFGHPRSPLLLSVT